MTSSSREAGTTGKHSAIGVLERADPGNRVSAEAQGKAGSVKNKAAQIGGSGRGSLKSRAAH